MKKTNLSFLHLSALAAITVICCSCSPKAKQASHLEAAELNFKSGQYDKAEIEYLNVLQIEPLNPRAISQLGLIYADQGRLGRVGPYLVKAKELQPDNLSVRLKIGQLYIAAGNFKQAQDEANFVLDRKPTDEEAPLLLAVSANKPDTVEAAVKRLKGLPPPAPDNAPVLIALGSLEFRQHHAKEAESYIQRALLQNPKSAAAQAAMGGWYRTQNDLPKAEAAFKRASELASPRSALQLDYAKFKAQTGDTESARRSLQEITVKTPDYLPAWILLAELTAAEKKYPESAALIAKVLARDPMHPEALLFSGRIQLALGENAKAATEMEKMLKLYPQSPQANYQLALAYVATGEFAKANTAVNQALTLAPNHTEAIVLLADLNLRKGDFNAVISALKPLVQQQPDMAQAAFLLAEAYRTQGNFAAAVAIYLKLEELFPRNSQAPYARGIALLQQKKPDEARLAFAKALEISPDFLLALEQLVNSDLVQKKYSAAHQRAATMMARNPKQASPYLLQAKIFFAEGDVPQTESSLQKAIAAEPDSPFAYLLLARLYSSSDQLEKALVNFQTAAAKSPKSVEALMMSATLLEKKGDTKAAREAYEKLLVVNPTFVPALNNLACLYSEKFNELDKAQELAQKARELSPHEPHINDTLGWILYKKRDYAWALGLLQESASKLEDSAEIQFHLGMTHYMMGNEESARGALQRALELEKDFSGSDEARQCLAILAINPLTAGASGLTSLEKTATARPEDPVVLSRLAASYAAAGSTEKAISTYQSALQKSPKNTTAMNALAILYAAHNETAKALELAKSARKLAPDDPEIGHTLGRLAYQTGDYSWSMSLLQDVVQKSPENAEILYDFAEAAYSVGRVADAESAMQRSLQAKPALVRTEQAQRFLAMTALAANPNPTAADQIEQTLKTNPTYLPALIAKAALSEQKSDAVGAKSIYEKVISLFPEFVPAKKRLVILYSKTPGANPQALALAVKTREALPNDAEVAKAYGIILFRAGDFTKAANLLKESAKQRPQDAELLFYLGAAQAKLKQPVDSLKSLQRALELKLDADLATDAQRILRELK